MEHNASYCTPPDSCAKLDLSSQVKGPVMLQKAKTSEGIIGDRQEALFGILEKIFEQWSLSTDERLSLLGIPKSTYYGIRRNPAKAQVSKDMEERISYVVNIYGILDMLFENIENKDSYLRLNNSSELFKGKSPIQYILENGTVLSLANVFQYLDSKRGGSW